MKQSIKCRGRPSHAYRSDAKDYGTPELRQKKQCGITSDPLDICLAQEWITSLQHRAGRRIEWLHSLRFNAPRTTAYDPGMLGGRSLQQEDSAWVAERSLEYKQISIQLEAQGIRMVVMDICVFKRLGLIYESAKVYVSTLTSSFSVFQLVAFYDQLS